MTPRGAGTVTTKVKTEHALHLRALGWAYDQIAAAFIPCPYHRQLLGMGVADCALCFGPMYTNRSAARKAVMRALAEEHPDTAAERVAMRQEMTAQLDLAIRAAIRLASTIVESGQRIPDGMMEAQRNLVRLLERKAKLWGLDAPNRVVITNELDEQIEQAVEQLVASMQT
jgi:hypothetical protein